jgi:hypothetical protein
MRPSMLSVQMPAFGACMQRTDVESEQRAQLGVHGVENLLRACVHLVADGILNHVAHELFGPLFSCCCCHVVCVCW